MIGKNVLITGASRGIGAACAVGLAEKGYNIIINYVSDTASAEKTLELCEKAGCGRHILLKTDVSDSFQVSDMFSRIDEEFGGIDILVNNAAVSSQQLFQDLTEEEWDRMFSVNIKSMFLCCKEAVPQMIRNKAGNIINISSVWGESGASCEVCYSSTKAAVIGFTKALAKELGLSGIRVNCVAPGVVSTDMNSHFSEETIGILKEEIPLGRIARPDEIADSVIFLAGDSSSYITGQILGVNGGMI